MKLGWGKRVRLGMAAVFEGAADGAGWSTMARRGEADQSLWLDSANPANQRAYASTDEAAVNTADSVTRTPTLPMTLCSCMSTDGPRAPR